MSTTTEMPTSTDESTQAPSRGWRATRTVAGFLLAVATTTGLSVSPMGGIAQADPAQPAACEFADADGQVTYRASDAESCADMADSDMADAVAAAQPGCNFSDRNIIITRWDVTVNSPFNRRCFATHKAHLVFQHDGNWVLYDERGVARFASRTVNRGFHLVLQRDGNLVIYPRSGRAVFATNTQNHPGAFLAVQTDGNVVIYSRTGRPLFATNTRH